MRISDFKLTAADFGSFGHGLRRPECVWADRDGVWASDALGGVCLVHADREPDGYIIRPDADDGRARRYTLLIGTA